MTFESFRGWTTILAAIVSTVVMTWQGHDLRRACDLLSTAQDEAQMAEAWHIRTGDALRACGVPRAAERAAEKACAARRFNDTSVVCD